MILCYFVNYLLSVNIANILQFLIKKIIVFLQLVLLII